MGENDVIYIRHLSVASHECSPCPVPFLGKSLSLFDLFFLTMVRSHIRVALLGREPLAMGT